MSERIFISQDAAHELLHALRKTLSEATGDERIRPSTVMFARAAIRKAESPTPSCSDCGADMVRNQNYPETYVCPNCRAKSGQE